MLKYYHLCEYFIFFRLGSRPLDLDINPDKMWYKTDPDIFQSQAFSGKRVKIDYNGDEISSSVDLLKLPSLLLEEESDLSKDVLQKTSGQLQAAREPNVYHRVFPGGIMVELPCVLEYDSPSKARYILYDIIFLTIIQF